MALSCDFAEEASMALAQTCKFDEDLFIEEVLDGRDFPKEAAPTCRTCIHKACVGQRTITMGSTVDGPAASNISKHSSSSGSEKSSVPSLFLDKFPGSEGNPVTMDWLLQLSQRTESYAMETFCGEEELLQQSRHHYSRARATSSLDCLPGAANASVPASARGGASQSSVVSCASFVPLALPLRRDWVDSSASSNSGSEDEARSQDPEEIQSFRASDSGGAGSAFSVVSSRATRSSVGSEDADRSYLHRMLVHEGVIGAVLQLVGNEEPELPHLTEEEIRALPKVHYHEIESQPCTICLELFKDDDVVTQLRCGHLFHSDCAASWMRRANFCPLCRAHCVCGECAENSDSVTLSAD